MTVEEDAPPSRPTRGVTIKHNISSPKDALSGDPTRAAAASAASGMIQAMVLLPLNTVQTQMQTSGHGAITAAKSNFTTGAMGGVRRLYRAITPTVGMLALRQGLKFGSATKVKQTLPLHWPEAARDVVAGSISAVSSTAIVFPLDTVKTRMQNGMPAVPTAWRQLYAGFGPAAAYSAIGMGLWVGGRNTIERELPYDGPGKHLLCGAAAGVAVQGFIFPLDTLKKRLQSSESGASLSALAEARRLLLEGGPLRFYRGFPLKCAFVALNGAIFNSVYVALRKALRLASDERAHRSLGPVDALTRHASLKRAVLAADG